MSIHIGRDKILILAFFISVIFLGSVLLVIPGVFSAGKLQYVDALFTSTSAVCVTGLITVDTAQYSRLGQIIIMLLIQTGGLGIITFATLFLALPRQRISIISKGVISDYALSEVEYQPKVIIRSIVKYTLCFEAIGAAAYAVRFRALGYPLFYAVFHAVSAFCNAGFSTFSDNLESFVADPTVNFTTMFLIIIGGIGFIVIRDLRKFLTGERTHLSYHSKIVFKTTAVLILGGRCNFLPSRAQRGHGRAQLPSKNNGEPFPIRHSENSGIRHDRTEPVFPRFRASHDDPDVHWSVACLNRRRRQDDDLLHPCNDSVPI